MITKEQAEAGIKAVKQLRDRCKYDPNKGYKWDVWRNPFTKEYQIIRYSSVSATVGFISRYDAKQFLADEENIKLLNQFYHIQ